MFWFYLAPIQVKVKDWDGNPITGTYYLPELLPVDKPEEFRIEKVIRERKLANKRKEYLVKWLGYPSSFNSWVSENQIRQLTWVIFNGLSILNTAIF